MKSKFALLLALFVTFSVTSCSEKDLYTGGETKKTMADLIVPPNFDWNMTTTVSCAFTAATVTPITVYTDKSCKDNSLIAEYTLVADMEALSLPVPCHITELYVKIGDATAIAVPVENGIARFAVPTSRADEGTLPGEYDQATNCIYFPSKDAFATVMFEDYFPLKGDYDFNDYVIHYNYVAHLGTNGNDPLKLHVASLNFTVKVAAIGGYFGYAPYLKVHGMKVNNKNGFEGEGAEILTGTDDDPIVAIIGYTPKPIGSYLNTDPNQVAVPYADLKTVTFTISANNNQGSGVKQEDLKFDFFLNGEKESGLLFEIHQRGFDSIDANCYPADKSGLGTVSYATSENLVWSFTIPAQVNHAIESVNFLDAYPEFKGWAESGGENNKQWYLNGKSEYLFVMN